MLHLKGYFPGRQAQINFELLYQAVDGRWRVFRSVGAAWAANAAAARQISQPCSQSPIALRAGEQRRE